MRSYHKVGLLIFKLKRLFHAFSAQKLLWRLALGTATAGLLVSTAIVGPSAAVASENTTTADPCTITFIGVRETGEAAGTGSKHGGRVYNVGGLGTRLIPLANAFSADPDFPVYMEQLAYPASAFPQFGTNNQLYTNSVATGAANLAAEIEYIVSICPYTNILLAGYSQGAQVIGNVLGGSPGLSPNAKDNITAVALFADASYRFGEPWDANYTLGGNGAFMRAKGAFNAYQGYVYQDSSATRVLVPRVRSVCLPNDLWCQSNPSGSSVHSNGYTSSVVSPLLALDARVHDQLRMSALSSPHAGATAQS